MSALGDPGFIIPLAIIQAGVLLVLVWGADVYEREPLGLVIGVALWGATAAVAIAVTARDAVLARLPSDGEVERAMSAALIEEPAKGAALLALAWGSSLAARRIGQVELEGVTDGLVYGAAIGLGFAFTEDAFFLVQQATTAEGLDVFVDRADLLGIAMTTHAVYTGVLGACLGLAAWERSRLAKIMLAVLGLGGAITLHAVHNGLAAAGRTTAQRAFDYAILGAFVGAFGLWIGRQRRIISTQLAEEVEAGLVTAAQAHDACHYLGRQRRRAGLVREGRLAQLRAAQDLDRELAELAFAKWRLDTMGLAGTYTSLDSRRRIVSGLAALAAGERLSADAASSRPSG